MADMIDYVPALKREIEPPGTSLFANVSNEAWVGYLGDAFWEARLDGFGEGYQAQENGVGDVELLTIDGGETVPRELIALVILYAGIKILRNRILNTQTAFKAKAGPVEFETQNAATMLAEMLKQLRATKERLIEQMNFGSHGSSVVTLDLFSTRLYDQVTYTGGPELAG